MTEQNWLNPLNKLRFADAFRKKAPQVTLLSGQRFSLTYTLTTVEVHPIPTTEFPNQFVPMGTFDLKQVRDGLWLAEQ